MGWRLTAIVRTSYQVHFSRRVLVSTGPSYHSLHRQGRHAAWVHSDSIYTKGELYHSSRGLPPPLILVIHKSWYFGCQVSPLDFYVYEIDEEWTKQTAGGPPTNVSSWLKNPKFALSAPMDCDVQIFIQVCNSNFSISCALIDSFQLGRDSKVKPAVNIALVDAGSRISFPQKCGYAYQCDAGTVKKGGTYAPIAHGEWCTPETHLSTSLTGEQEYCLVPFTLDK